MKRMSNECNGCADLKSVVEEQKSKLKLLETRLKDLVLAYKNVCKERDNLELINNRTVSIENESKYQRRIAELEDSVCQMSKMCGKLESGRKEDKDRIKELQLKYEHLSRELDSTKELQKKMIANSLSDDADDVVKKIQTQNNSTQTDEIIVDFDEKKIIEEDDRFGPEKLIQEENFDPPSLPIPQSMTLRNETAIVAPLLQEQSKSETNSTIWSQTSLDDNTERMRNDDHSQSKSNDPVTPINSNISLYHINELARKDLEIADYRVRIREYECLLRDLQWNFSRDKYRLQSRISDLEMLNKNLMSSDREKSQLKGFNNINIAYIKNVLVKVLETNDIEKRKSMINALNNALDSIQTD